MLCYKTLRGNFSGPGERFTIARYSHDANLCVMRFAGLVPWIIAAVETAAAIASGSFSKTVAFSQTNWSVRMARQSCWSYSRPKDVQAVRLQTRLSVSWAHRPNLRSRSRTTSITGITRDGRDLVLRHVNGLSDGVNYAWAMNRDEEVHASNGNRRWMAMRRF